MLEFDFSSHGAGMIHAYRWEPEGQPRGVVQIIHGIAEYVPRYAGFAAFLNAHGLLVTGEDHMGHGKSHGTEPCHFSGGWCAAVDDSILIDVGDILQGSALSSYNILQEGGENSPMATALRYIGYDAFVLGNHEFNYAPQIQWNYYNLLTSTDKAVAGQPVDVICSNVVETETNESVFSPYKTFTYKFEDGTTFTIGLLGFENMNNANWDVASHYEGCTFGHPDNTEKSYVYEWENYYGKEMQEKCDYIIVAMHSGEGNPDIYNQENQGGYFATHTTGVDMLLTGHNHQRNAVTLQNKNGENVLVMNGGGSTLGETVLTLTKGADGKVTVTAAESTMHPLNSALGKDENGRDIRVPSPDFKSGDPNYDGLKDLITPLFERSDAFVNKKIGTVSGTWDTISNYYLTQSDSYDLVHKAQIWAACTDNNIDPTKEHVISMTTPVAKRGWSVSSLLADGTYDAYFEPMLHVWDIAGIAAGTVVVWEAQGTLSRWDGERIHWRHDNDVVASNGLIIRELQHYLQQYPWLDSINQR